MVFICSVPTCKNTSKEQKMHVLPANVEKFTLWTTAINRTDIPFEKRRNYSICDIHFSDDMKFPIVRNRTNLKVNSVPDLFLPQCDSTRHSNTEIQDDLSISNSDVQQPGPSGISLKRGHLIDVREEELTIKYPKVDVPAPSGKTRSTVKRRLNLYKVISTPKQYVSPRKEKLIHIAKGLAKTAKQLEKQNANNKLRIKMAYEYSMSREFLQTKLNKQSLNFFMAQLKLQTRKEKGRRFSLDDKLFALAILKHGPKAYRLLRHYFALPSRRTLLNLVQHVTFKVGINPNVMASLKESTTKLNHLDKYCTLIFDEMAIEPSLTYKEQDDVIEGFQNCGMEKKKTFASHAFVFMARGIRKKWKQPVAYYFSEHGMSATDIMRNLKIIISELQKINLKVIATICDQASANMSAIKMLIDETKRKYLRMDKEHRSCGFEVNGEEVIPLYDPPHLLKGLRNNFINAEIQFSWKKLNQKASWSHIVQLYEMDVKDEIKICYKLTDAHIYADKIRKMKVKNAAQVFSHSVSAGIRSNVKWGLGKLLPQEALNTADFVSFVDSLFDSVNGSTIRAVYGKPLKCAISPTSAHLDFWNEAVSVFNSMVFIKRGTTVRPPTIKNWIITIQGLKYLWEKLSQGGFDYVCTRNFNQDPLENFFGNIRSHGIRNINPTCTSFVNSFKSLLISSFMSPHSPNSNCEADENEGALTSLKHFIYNSDIVIEGIDELPNLENEEELFSFSSEHAAGILHLYAYVAGYTAKKILKCVGQCEHCRKALIETDDNEYNILINYKTYTAKKLLTPNTKFIKIFSECMQVLKYYVPLKCTDSNISKFLIHKLTILISQTFNCPDHNLFYIFSKFLTIFFLHVWTKNVNKILKGLDHRNMDDTIKKLAFKKYQTYKTKKRAHQ